MTAVTGIVGRRCAGDGCKRRIGPANRTGYCPACYRRLPLHRKLFPLRSLVAARELLEELVRTLPEDQLAHVLCQALPGRLLPARYLEAVAPDAFHAGYHDGWDTCGALVHLSRCFTEGRP